MKTAIFVEGQTELIIVRELIIKYFNYQNVSVACYTLFANDRLNTTEYAFPAPNQFEDNHFQIVNAGSDNAVLTRILHREEQLFNAGYSTIIGLRDMFSENYIKVVKNRTIQDDINQRFKESHSEQIRNRSVNPGAVSFHFAIMEAEAWILGIPSVFTRLDARLTIEFIRENLGYDLNDIDPESEFFHPAKELESIYDLVGLRYDKRKGDINRIASLLAREDYEELNNIEKCDSFSDFYSSLVNLNPT